MRASQTVQHGGRVMAAATILSKQRARCCRLMAATCVALVQLLAPCLNLRLHAACPHMPTQCSCLLCLQAGAAGTARRRHVWQL